MPKTITSANSVFTLTAAGLFTAPVRLQGYMADAAFATDAADTGEFVQGVDGIMSVGWTPRMYRQTISLQADSDSNDIFDAIVAAEDAARIKIELQATIIMPSIRKQFACTKGYVSNYVPIPSAQRVLQGRPFGITWERISPAPL